MSLICAKRKQMHGKKLKLLEILKEKHHQIEEIFDDFIELHGDRNFRDDKAIVCGLANIGEQNFTIVTEQKGRSTKENIERNFGMPNPESYRKAIRFMEEADKFRKTSNYFYRY